MRWPPPTWTPPAPPLHCQHSASPKINSDQQAGKHLPSDKIRSALGSQQQEHELYG